MSEAFFMHHAPLVTIAAFDAFVEAQSEPRLWDLLAGRIIAMNNPTDDHEKIVSNLGRALASALNDRNCHVFFGGMRVQRSDDARGHDKPRPDLLVRCGPLTGKTYATDPLVVVEVLSPSSMDYDRGDKLGFYKRQPTMNHILLVYQDEMRIEHYRRTDIAWVQEALTAPQDRLVLEAIGFQTTLDTVYTGLALNR